MKQPVLSLFSALRQSLLQPTTKSLITKPANHLLKHQHRLHHCSTMLPRIPFSSDFFFRQVSANN